MALIFRTFSDLFNYFLLTRGDALRTAQRLPLALIFRAFGASPINPDFKSRDFETK